MSKSFETQGVIHSIGDTTEYGKNGFTKREFVIKVTGDGENSDYPNYVALELIKDKCALMDRFKVGQEIRTTFNLSGRLWSGNGRGEKCFTSLQAWKVEPLDADAAGSGDEPPPDAYDQSAMQSADAGASDFDDDIPF